MLGHAGIPSILFGPGGAGLHSTEEYVNVADVVMCRDALVELVECGLDNPAIGQTSRVTGGSLLEEESAVRSGQPIRADLERCREDVGADRIPERQLGSDPRPDLTAVDSVSDSATRFGVR